MENILEHFSEGEIEINRWDLVQILSKKVGEIEIIYGGSITNIDGKMVHFEQMEPREFDIVVGADGQYSNVRRLAFGEDAAFLKRYGIQFCVFPIPNIFNLERCEIVYFDNGKLATAYAVGNHSYACLAFKSEEETLPLDNLQTVFEKQFQGLAWEVPRVVSLMKKVTNAISIPLPRSECPLGLKDELCLLETLLIRFKQWGQVLLWLELMF